jgi:Tol biopolymer transport system component/predicted Ser/Thr protein kinase
VNPEKWQQIKHVLGECLEMSRSDRQAYLERACAGEPEVRTEVESLIASYEEAGDLLEAPALETGAAVVTAKINEMDIGLHVGPYRVIDEIGEGGMGHVYRAVRDDRSQQEVAIKVVKRGMDTNYILRRFQNERQILANLDHPNIAHFFDGGTTRDGRPYFVMEYVNGKPLDEYCDEHKLSTAERLRLFRTVCEAIQFAHQNRVVHRDIKPNNILVTSDGDLKLLDFGIAKILNRDPSSQTGDSTATLMQMMTPEYASPEQARGDHITEASDIYSLGVLLYKLLTGHTPYGIKSRMPQEMANIICETAPVKPSSIVRRIETLYNSDGTRKMFITPEMVSRTRDGDPERLRRCLTGDLDTILLMALRKEPKRRYQSVQEFNDDIRRHLEGVPVRARRDTVFYRASKTLQRNRSIVLIGTVLAVLIAVAGFGLHYYARSTQISLAQLTITPFTSFPGNETQASFSPDGKKIVFVWGGDSDDNSDIYVKTIETGDLVRLTHNPAEDVSPVWSPDGRRIAFLRSSNIETAIYVAQADSSGFHGKITDVYKTRIEAVGRHMDWSPDGKYLAVSDKNSSDQPFRIVLVTAADGTKKDLTSPPERFIGDSGPAFSPDGKMVAFIRASNSGVDDIFVVSATGGEPKQITFDHRYTLSLSWTADGKSIVFSSNRTGNHALWKIPGTGGTPVRLPLSENAKDAMFARDGHRLAFSQFFDDTNIWRIDLSGPGRLAGTAKKVISSTQYDSSPQISPDGKRIAFRSNRSGNHEVWISDENGRNARQFTFFGGTLTGTPRWSPDGNWLSFDSRPNRQADVFIAPASGGTPRAITVDPAEDVVASWSHDGKHIYFASNRTGVWQVWRKSIDSGSGEQVTHNGGFAAFESPDGKYLYYAKGRSVAGLWRMPTAGGLEELVLNLKPGYWGMWAIDKGGIYYIDRPEAARFPSVYFYSLGTKRTIEVLKLDRQVPVGESALALSPDGRYLLFTQSDDNGSDVMIADNPSGW